MKLNKREKEILKEFDKRFTIIDDEESEKDTKDWLEGLGFKTVKASALIKKFLKRINL